MNIALPTRRLITLLLVSILYLNTAKAGVEPIPAGSFIVNMGVVPQTYANGLKPWGMVYDLIHNYKVQVKWVISQSKSKDGTDFTYNGIYYKGGTLIIPPKYRSAAVNARITYWQTLGVVGVTTTSDFTADVAYNLKYTPRWTFDFQNGSIAINYLTLAGIPSDSYPKKNPEDLNECDDLFVMPHADPTWDTHKNLYYWNKSSRGWIWDGCHATSVMESLVNPVDPTEQMNFLSQKGLVMYSDHNNPTPPFAYRFPNDPEMQFMGTVDAAVQNGSEEAFLPLLNSTWRSTTQVAVYDPSQSNIPLLSPGEAGIILYGRAFGDISRGKVMYEAGHSLDKNNADAVSAIRAFLNFSFLSVSDKVVTPIINGPTNILFGGTYNYIATLPAGADMSNYTFHWSSTLPGVFSRPFGSSTSFSPGAVSSCTNGSLMVTITDGCGREYYETFDLNGLCPIPPVALDRTTAVLSNAPGTTAKPIGSLTPLAGSDSDGYVVNYVIKSLPLSGVLYYDNDNNPATADVAITSLSGGELILTNQQMKSLKYDPVDGFGNNVSFLYTVVDNIGLRDLTPATYTIPVDPPPVATSFVCTPVNTNSESSHLCSLQATDDGSIASYTIVTLPPSNQCTIYLYGVPVTAGQVLSISQSSLLTFKPAGGYIGYSEMTYTATDNKGLIDETPATLTIQMVNQPPVVNDISANSITNVLVQTSIPSLSATDADGTIASYLITNAPLASQGILYYNNSGVYTAVGDNKILTVQQAGSLKFDPVDTYTGVVKFKYTATDNSGLTSPMPATYSIPVKSIVPVANNRNNANIYTGAGLTAISTLTGSDPDTTNIITAFIVTQLPAAHKGVLYYNTGTSYVPVVAGAELSPSQGTSLKFAPVAGYIGTVTFKYTVKDDEGLTDPTAAIFTIPVTDAAPQVSNVNSWTIYDTSGIALIKPLSGSDDDGTITSYTIISLPDPSTGILYLNGIPVTAGQILTPADAALLEFDPVLHNNADAKFKYTATDNFGVIDQSFATYTVPISFVNYKKAPHSQDVNNPNVNTRSILKSIVPMAADDTDGVIAMYQIKSLSSHDGTVYLQGIPVTNNQYIPANKIDQLTFQPSGNYKGNTDFKFKSYDNDGLESAGNGNFTIPIVNAKPVAVDKESGAVKKGMTTKIPGLAASDSDGVVSSYKILTLPTLGTLQYDQTGTGSYVSAAINTVLTPVKAASLRIIAGTTVGTTSFTYTATDNLSDVSAVATYTIPVAATAENQRPIANDITSTAVPVTAAMTAISPLTATDVDGTIASYVVITVPPACYGMLFYTVSGTTLDSIPIGWRSITAAQAATLKFVPSGNYSGDVTFKFRAVDNSGESNPEDAIYTIPVMSTVVPVCSNITSSSMASNAGPTAIGALSATGVLDHYIITTLPSSDQGILVLDGTAVQLNQNISLIDAARLEFDPNPSFSGSATFTYSATDKGGGVDLTPATVTIPVANSAPVADNKLSQVITNQIGTPAQSIPDLTGSDADGTISKFLIKTLPAGGVLYKNGTAITTIPTGGYILTTGEAGKMSFDPNDNFSGTTSFTYTVQDNSNNLSTVATYQIVVNAPPVTSNITANAFYPSQPKGSIPALQGSDDGSIAFWTILSLPDPADGYLYINNVQVTNLSQVASLSAAQVAQLSFQALQSFDGAIFTYTATDNLGVIDVTPAVYLIPLSALGPLGPLSVELVSFTGNKAGTDNQLKWTTSQEINTDHFEIERSDDGSNFLKAGTVSAAGNSSISSDYSFIDRNAVKTYYYRLKTIDRDGKSKLSNVILIKRSDVITISKSFPDPFTSQVTIDISAESNTNSTVNIFDVNGRTIRTMEVSIKSGQNHIVVNDLGNLSSGMYILKVITNDSEVNVKMYKA